MNSIDDPRPPSSRKLKVLIGFAIFAYLVVLICIATNYATRLGAAVTTALFAASLGYMINQTPRYLSGDSGIDKPQMFYSAAVMSGAIILFGAIYFISQLPEPDSDNTNGSVLTYFIERLKIVPKESQSGTPLLNETQSRQLKALLDRPLPVTQNTVVIDRPYLITQTKGATSFENLPNRFLILFDENSEKLSTDENLRTDELIKGLNALAEGCTNPLKVKISGFASSSPVQRTDQLKRAANMKLANDRANRVTSKFRGYAHMEPLQTTWDNNNYEEMASKKLKDASSKNGYIIPIGALNRRVEIIVDYDSCN